MTKKEREQKQLERFISMKAFDKAQYSDLDRLAGIDEAGRGPLAGPVVAACVVLGNDFDVIGIDDSKKLSQKKREELFDEITAKSLAYGIGIEDNTVIDKINILQATKKAMETAVENACRMLVHSVQNGEEKKNIEFLILDAVRLERTDIMQEPVIKGDAKSLSVAAASIIAKVTRDRMMEKYHEIYPEYGFDRNKGYGTKAHYEALSKNGITPIHRKTFLKNL